MARSRPLASTRCIALSVEERSFEGKDERWTAINSYNFATGDFEAYVPDAITTKDGYMVITSDTQKITLDVSGSPRAFSSGTCAAQRMGL